VLVDQQVAAERTDSRAVLGRRPHLLGEAAGSLGSAAAAAVFDPMLGDGHAQLRQVEHLADLDSGD
jgi:hypothetical protein